MTIEMVAAIGGLVMLFLLGALAVISQLSDNETSGFTIAVGIVFVVGAFILFTKAGI